MCSIFGYVANPGHEIPLSVLRRMANQNVQRGPHAFGFAWITPEGRLRSYRQAGRITDYLGLLAMTRGARLLIGHVRYATHGEPANNINNHPHPVDGGWLVHNGVVHNYCDLLKERRLLPVSQCDSEAIGLLVEAAPQKSLLARTAAAVASTAGNLAILALWSKPARLIVARRGNPLSMVRTREGRFFSTLVAGLPDGRGRDVDDGTATEYTFAYNLKGAPNARVLKIPARESDRDVSPYNGREADARSTRTTAEYHGG